MTKVMLLTEESAQQLAGDARPASELYSGSFAEVARFYSRLRGAGHDTLLRVLSSKDGFLSGESRISPYVIQERIHKKDDECDGLKDLVKEVRGRTLVMVLSYPYLAWLERAAALRKILEPSVSIICIGGTQSQEAVLRNTAVERVIVSSSRRRPDWPGESGAHPGALEDGEQSVNQALSMPKPSEKLEDLWDGTKSAL